MTPGASPSATRDLVRAFLRHGWLVPLALVPAVVLLVQTPTSATGHVGSTTVSVVPATGAEVRELRLFDAWLRRHVDTFAHLATTNSVLQDVSAAPGVASSPKDLADRILVAQPDNRELVTLEVTGEDADETAVTAQAAGDALARHIVALSPRDAGGKPLVAARALDASVSRADDERPVLLAAALAALGLLAAAAWVMWRFATDDVIRSTRDLATITRAPIIATLREGDAADQAGTVRLRLHLDSVRTDPGPARLVGTSASAAEAFEVRERLMNAWTSTAESSRQVEVVHPSRIPTVPDALVVATVTRLTATRLVHVLCTIEQRGGNVAGVVAHVPRRWRDRLRRRQPT